MVLSAAFFSTTRSEASKLEEYDADSKRPQMNQIIIITEPYQFCFKGFKTLSDSVSFTIVDKSIWIVWKKLSGVLMLIRNIANAANMKEARTHAHTTPLNG